jgi:Ca2+-binding RTX toxin-like protein
MRGLSAVAWNLGGVRAMLSETVSARRVRPIGALVVAAMVGALLPAFPMTAAALDCVKLYSDDPSGDSQFGSSVAISNDWLVVGAPWDNGTDGSVSVYEPDGAGGWSHVQLLTGEDDGGQFGHAVALSGDRIVVGAPNVPSGEGALPGAAYLFEFDGTGWSGGKLPASDLEAGDRLGISVAIDDGVVVVGVSGNPRNVDPGAAFIYELSGGAWIEVASASGEADGVEFGHSVGVSGDRVVVGARFDGQFPNGNAGSVYVFERDPGGGWDQGSKVVADDFSAGDFFGSSVAIEGDRIVVGAPSDDNGSGSVGPGSIYILDADGAGGWSQVELRASDVLARDNFGHSAAVSAGRVVAGAPEHGSSSSGSGYLFEQNESGGWVETEALYDDVPNPSETFGSAVDMSDTQLAVGIPQDQVPPTSELFGSVCVYTFAPNQPPVAAAGVDVMVDEGGSVVLDGSGSFDPDGEVVSYSWDPDPDTFWFLNDAAAEQPLFTGVDDGVVTMSLVVTDDDGAQSEPDTADVTVVNVDPVVEAGADQTVGVGVPVSLDPAAYSDTGIADTHQNTTVDWGDGTVSDCSLGVDCAVAPNGDGTGEITGSHAYTADGSYTVTVTVTDDNGGTDSDTLTVTVNQANNECDIVGTNGNDVLVGTNVSETICGLGGNDIITGNDGNDVLLGGAGNDRLRGGSGNDDLSGGAGNDSLFGEDGDDEIVGDAGNDDISGGNGNDSAVGNDGTDAITGGPGADILSGSDGADDINGGDGADDINGGEGVDQLNGNSGDDEIIGGGGGDDIAGGSGHDIVDGGEDNDDVNGGPGNDVLRGSGGTDNISGGDGGDDIVGGDGADDLSGNAGADEISSGAGNDEITGGDGIDSVDAGEGTDNVSGGAGDDFLRGSDGNDTIRGGAGADDIGGGAAQDDLYGDAGNDTIQGNDGNDIMIGGSGDDTLGGGDGHDYGDGGAGADTVSGAFGRDFLLGGPGNDEVDGGPAATSFDHWNRLFGGAGNGDECSFGPGTGTDNTDYRDPSCERPSPGTGFLNGSAPTLNRFP